MKETQKTERIKIPQAVREYVFQRDNCQCQACGKTQLETELNIDHIIPLARGGSNDISNLQTLCRTCNQSKKHHFDSRFKRRYS
ncbi:MAG: HNH endonuclease [Desertifilum sp. SIO1I2]|nr:HNH endonuclease [Desertifilum sp. SIO1I2]